MLTLTKVRNLLDRIDYDGHGKTTSFVATERAGGFMVQIRFMDNDVVTHELAEQSGRKWYVSRHATDSEVIQTALKAALASAEHEVRERFRVDGVLPYGPHMDIDALVGLLKSTDATDARAAA